MNSTHFDEHMDQALDDALMGTFPASDPVSLASPHRHCGAERKSGAQSTERRKAGRTHTPSPA